MGGVLPKNRLPASIEPVSADVFKRVCQVKDLKEKTLQEFDFVESQKVVLVKDGGTIHAVSNKCTHLGAPLVKGAYCNGSIRCPYHGACFNVKSGDIEDFPGLDSIHSYKVRVEGEDVIVSGAPVASHKRQKNCTQADLSDKRTFIIVGSGGASLACAETLRQEGYGGKIEIITKEKYIPYDRTKLSKAMTSDIDTLALRKEDFLDAAGIKLKLEQEVTAVQVSQKTLKLKSGLYLKYDRLLLALGGSPRLLDLPGESLLNISYLRTIGDANALISAAKDQHVLIVGCSFIGMESAAYLVDKAKSVTVVGRDSAPFCRILGRDIGNAILKLHIEKKVKFVFKSHVQEFVGDEEGKVKEAKMSDGSVIECNVCLIGAGVTPTTGFLQNSGIKMNKAGYLQVDKCMQTSEPSIFAAGDVTEFPLFLCDNSPVNIQHWQMAHAQGRIAALNMLGHRTEIRSVPFFWTVQFGKSLRYAGYAPDFKDVVIHGNLDELKFAAFYLKDDIVQAVCSMGMDPVVAEAAQIMLQGRRISKMDISDSPDLFDLLSSLKC